MPAIAVAPLAVVWPKTVRVEVGCWPPKPIPTRLSLMFTINVPLVLPIVVVALIIVVVATAKPQLSAGVVVAMLNRPETLRLLSMVEEPVTKMPAAVLVGLRVLAMPGFSCQAPLGATRAVQVKTPLSAISCSQALPVQAVPK